MPLAAAAFIIAWISSSAFRRHMGDLIRTGSPLTRMLTRSALRYVRWFMFLMTILVLAIAAALIVPLFQQDQPKTLVQNPPAATSQQTTVPPITINVTGNGTTTNNNTSGGTYDLETLRRLCNCRCFN